MNRDEKNAIARNLILARERVIIVMHDLDREDDDQASEYNKLELILEQITNAYNDL